MILKNQNGSNVYSDGDATELEMLKIATEYPGDLSEEYISKDSRYTVNNTFSSVRQNILNWYPFKKDCDILEIGAGMGAVTGLLCSKAENVTAIEMNEVRAEIIRTRHAKQKNLRVISENINNWNDTHKYDYIVMIGVFEYAGVFTTGDNPFVTFLQNVKKHLKDNGTLLCAIENRFGLKYWCGAAEDHLGKTYVGIEGYKEEKTPVTFSKKQIEDMLEKVKLKYNRFYYVLPDYKFPTGVYTDEYMPSYDDLQKVAFTYSRNSLLSINEKDIYKDIIENNELSFFANSYLFEASAKELSQDKVIFATGRGECQKDYRITTIIDSKQNVYKLPVHSKAINHLKATYENGKNLKEKGIKILDAQYENGVIKSRFYKGIKADKIFEKYLTNNDLKSLFKLIDLLKINLLKSSDVSNKNENILTKNNIAEKNIDFGIILEEGYIDMTFYNCFYENEQLIFFDQEWKFTDVPLSFILYYALKTAYYRSKVTTLITFEDILDYLKIKNQHKYYDKLEEFIWSNVLYRQGDFYGQDGYCNQYNDSLTLNQHLKCKEAHIELLLESERNLQNDVDSLTTQINNKNGHIELLLQSERKLQNDKRNLQNDKRNLQNQVEFFKIEINNKNAHIELLLESDRELERIKSSRSWRFMSYAWKFRDGLAPHGSKRRLLIKITVKFVKHPIRFMKKLSPERIRKFFYYLNREGVSNVSSRLDECVIGNSNQKLNLDIMNVNIHNKKVYKVSDFEKLIFDKTENPKVSIIIPVYNQIHYTYACLKSILENSKNVSYEVIIGNDCSTDITTEINKFVENITVITTDENLRFLRNCNNAAKYAKGEYILFLNNDTQVQENWLEPLVTLIESDDSVGMVGSKLIYPDCTLQEAGGIVWDDASGWNYGRLSNPKDSEFSYVKECDYISGASMMIKHSLWKEIGGFDERFAPAYYEDSDLAFEVRRHGYKVMLQPLSIVVHFEGISNGTDLSSGQKAYQVKNCETFKEKWKDELQKQFKNGENVFVAKDRSKDKKHILVVDHYVPHYDKDAGGKCTYMYIKLFASLGMKVTFIGDNFYPHQPYTLELQQMGVEVLYGNYYYNNWKKWLKDNGTVFDYVYLNRPHISEKYIDLVRDYTSAKIIYFGHDLHYLREFREHKITGDKEKLKSSNEWKKREYNLFNKVDVIHVVGSYEEGILKKEFEDKPVRNIPVYIYDNVRTNVNKNFKKRENIIFVGGFGHPPNADAVLWFAEKIFPRVLEKYPDIIWYIVGSRPPEKVQGLACKNIVVTGFISDEELAQLYEKSRVAVVPLRVGAGVKGKVIEAIYNQIPLITTSIGAEGLSLREHAFAVADKEEEFSDKVIELYENFDKLKELSDNSIEFIQNYFTSEIAKKVVLADIDIK